MQYILIPVQGQFEDHHRAVLYCGLNIQSPCRHHCSPVGFRVDFTNLAPWLYTLQIPVAVLAASMAAVGWALSRLDPLAVIERQ